MKYTDWAETYTHRIGQVVYLTLETGGIPLVVQGRPVQVALAHRAFEPLESVIIVDPEAIDSGIYSLHAKF